MNESWQNLNDLVVNPTATFTRLKSQARWVFAFVVFFVLSVGLLWMIAPFTIQLINSQIVNSGQSTKVTTFTSYLARGSVVLIFWCFLLSGILLLAARVFNIRKALAFKHVFAGVVHFSLVGTLAYFINAAMLPLFRRVEDMKETVDLKIVPGLHLLAGPIDNPHLLTFLSHINPLSAWYIFVITIAVSVMAEVSRTKACCVALIVWLLRVGAEIMFLAMSLE